MHLNHLIGLQIDCITSAYNNRPEVKLRSFKILLQEWSILFKGYLALLPSNAVIVFYQGSFSTNDSPSRTKVNCRCHGKYNWWKNAITLFWHWYVTDRQGGVYVRDWWPLWIVNTRWPEILETQIARGSHWTDVRWKLWHAIVTLLCDLRGNGIRNACYILVMSIFLKKNFWVFIS